MHRLLELGVVESDLLRVAHEFSLDQSQAQQALHMARAIRHGEGAWAWEPAQLAWSGDEVTIAHRGRVLRMDRLVQRRDSHEWWVLDYKSGAHPDADATLYAQLETYRVAVAGAYPGQRVRAAFLTPQGAVLEPAAQQAGSAP